jgi:hypothetical protein
MQLWPVESATKELRQQWSIYSLQLSNTSCWLLLEHISWFRWYSWWPCQGHGVVVLNLPHQVVCLSTLFSSFSSCVPLTQKNDHIPENRNNSSSLNQEKGFTHIHRSSFWCEWWQWSYLLNLHIWFSETTHEARQCLSHELPSKAG